MVASPAGAAVLGYYRFPPFTAIKSSSTVKAICSRSRRGGVAMRLTSHPANETNPFFSPDGRMLAFSADYQGNGDIYVMPSDGGEPKRSDLSPQPRAVRRLDPDGKFVLFTARRSGLDSETSLYKVPVDGGEPEQLPVGVASSASYSSDGKMIAFNPLPGAHVEALPRRHGARDLGRRPLVEQVLEDDQQRRRRSEPDVGGRSRLFPVGTIVPGQHLVMQAGWIRIRSSSRIITNTTFAPPTPMASRSCTRWPVTFTSSG
jgi:Tol biopolymer transport system component